MVQERIKELILSQHLAPGAPLPTEGELMRDLQVGRNAVREAVKGLEALGIVEVRHGYGTYVGSSRLYGLADGLSFFSRLSLNEGIQAIHELVEVREVLESGLLRRTTSLLDGDTLRELEQALGRMEAVARSGDFSAEEDRRFHQLLYQPVGNHLITDLLGIFWDVYLDVSDELRPVQVDPMQNLEWHRAIFEAVAARRSDEAAAAMVRHFSGIRQRLEVTGNGQAGKGASR